MIEDEKIIDLFFERSEQGIQAVSYTHLDVYKRQLLHCLSLNNADYKNANNKTV